MQEGGGSSPLVPIMKTNQYPENAWNCVRRQIDIYNLEGSVEDAIKRIEEAAKGLESPRIASEDNEYEHAFIEVVGYVPKTAAEKTKYRKRQIAVRESRLQDLEMQRQME